MRKAKEVLRLHSLGLKQQQIARSCSISQSTVHEYLKAAEAGGVGWPLPADWDDQRLTEVLSGKRQPHPEKRKHALPDFAVIHQELQKHSHLTLQLVWQGQRETKPESHRLQ